MPRKKSHVLLRPPTGEQPGWVFGKGKHAGSTLDEVAVKNPGYLIWARRIEELGDAEFYAIEDARERHNIADEFRRPQPRRSMHITRQRKK